MIIDKELQNLLAKADKMMRERTVVDDGLEYILYLVPIKNDGEVGVPEEVGRYVRM